MDKEIPCKTMIAVSVVIPVYNVEGFIENCARSLFSQTLENMEFIFVDDCSKDKSIEIIERILEEYPNRKEQVTIYRQKENGGPSKARNVGIKLAKGDFITFCDSDDWVESDMYESMYKKACDTTSEIVFCDFFMEFKDKRVEYQTFDINDTDKNLLLNNYITTVWTVLWNMLAKRALFVEHKLSLPVDIKYCEDFHLMVRLVYYARKVTKMNNCFYHYNQCNSTSIMKQDGIISGGYDLKSYFSIIDFFKSHDVISLYEKTMSWRVLNSIRLSVYDKTKHAEIKEIYPVCHKYILSNPFYSRNEKIYVWLLMHNCRLLLSFILYIRSLKNNLRI